MLGIGSVRGAITGSQLSTLQTLLGCGCPCAALLISNANAPTIAPTTDTAVTPPPFRALGASGGANFSVFGAARPPPFMKVGFSNLCPTLIPFLIASDALPGLPVSGVAVGTFPDNRSRLAFIASIAEVARQTAAASALRSLHPGARPNGSV